MSYEVVTAQKKDCGGKFVQYKPGKDYPRGIITESSKDEGFVGKTVAKGPDGLIEVNDGDWVKVDDSKNVIVLTDAKFQEDYVRV